MTGLTAFMVGNAIAHPMKERHVLFGLLAALFSLAFLTTSWSIKTTLPVLLVLYGSFYIYLCWVAKRHHKRAPMVSASTDTSFPQNRPKVSILIPAHNEASILASMIQNTLKQDYPDYELIVVDDRSTDETGTLLNTLSALNSRFRFFRRPLDARPGKAAALNEAFAHVGGDILCFLDADAIIGPDFLSRMVPYFEDAKVGAVQSRKSVCNSRQNLLTLCQQYEYAMDAALQSERDAVLGAAELRGSGMLIRKEILQSLGGWNENSIAEDLALCTRMHLAGWDIRYTPDILIQEEAIQELLPLFRQRRRWTEGSLIRYLEHLKAIALNPQLAFRMKLDMAQFVFEFIAPVWLLFENILFTFKGIGQSASGPRILYSTPALLILSVYFAQLTYRGISRFNHASPIQALAGTMLTYGYLSCMWLPLVFVVGFRILSRKERDLKWHKTPRYGMVLE